MRLTKITNFFVESDEFDKKIQNEHKYTKLFEMSAKKYGEFVPKFSYKKKYTIFIFGRNLHLRNISDTLSVYDVITVTSSFLKNTEQAFCCSDSPSFC